MRITSLLLYRVHNIPYRFRGKNRIVKQPSMRDLIQMKRDLVREEQNMLILRHPYLTVEQSHGHMSEFKEEKFMKEREMRIQKKNEKYNKRITIADRLSHLTVQEVWD